MTLGTGHKLALLAVAECKVYDVARVPKGADLILRGLERRDLIRRIGNAYVLTDAGFTEAAAIVDALPG